MTRAIVGLALSIGLVCACDLTRAPDAGSAGRDLEIASSSPGPFGTFAPLGTVSTDGSVTGDAGPSKDRSLDGSTPSPSPSASPSAALSSPPAATSAPPTKTPSPTATPTSAPPTATTPPSPTAPVITSFTPLSGPPGTVVFIVGIRLASVDSVSFGGARGLLLAASATGVTAVVPSAAQTGPITLAGPAGFTASAANFLVTAPQTATPTPAPTLPTCIPTRNGCF